MRSLSDCSFLFPIGMFHTNSFLCHPLDCTEVVCFWTLQPESAASAARRNHDTTTAADVGGATLWPPASSSAAVACPRRRYRGRRRRRRKTATVADVGGASYHLLPLGCWLAQRRRDGCPVASTCWVMQCDNKHPCNPTWNSVCRRCRCISSAIVLRAGAPALKQHVIWQTYIVIYQSYASHMTGIYWYIPPIMIWHHVRVVSESSDTSMTGICDSQMTTHVIWLSYTCHIHQQIRV